MAQHERQAVGIHVDSEIIVQCSFVTHVVLNERYYVKNDIEREKHTCRESEVVGGGTQQHTAHSAKIVQCSNKMRPFDNNYIFATPTFVNGTCKTMTVLNRLFANNKLGTLTGSWVQW